MRKIYLCLGIAFLVGMALCQADTTKKLIVTYKSGAARQFDVTKIGEISFNNNNMIMFLTNGFKESLNMSDIQKMTFDVQITGAGLEKVEACAGAGLQISLENKIMTLTERNGKEIEISVYNANGGQILKTKGLGKILINFNEMTSGAYILKANDKSIKYIN